MNILDNILICQIHQSVNVTIKLKTCISFPTRKVQHSVSRLGLLDRYLRNYDRDSPEARRSDISKNIRRHHQRTYCNIESSFCSETVRLSRQVRQIQTQFHLSSFSFGHASPREIVSKFSDFLSAIHGDEEPIRSKLCER